tara:strand:+ start:1185 stop:1658 length:474 start_codon:yes stop_codon:yes gene_type:complete
MSTVVATNINTDALVGNTSANAITVRGEGSATTSLQQGLCKTWCDYRAGTLGGSSDGNSTISIEDSFNVASLVDNGTGDYTFAHTNDMASGNYVFLGGSQYETGAIASVTTIRIKSGDASNKAAATMRIASQYSNTSGNCTQYDYAQQQFAVHGDLA